MSKQDDDPTVSLGDANERSLQDSNTPTLSSEHRSLRVSVDRTAQSPAPQADTMIATITTLDNLEATNDSDTPQDAADSTTAAPYGTRSRNRTGGVRPNYADDKEIDHFIEANGKLSKPTLSKASTAASSAPSKPSHQDTAGQAPSRGGFAAVNGALLAPNGTTPPVKDSIPGMSTFSANPNSGASAPAPSKKRKQPGSNGTSPPTGTTGSVTTTKTRTTTAGHPRQHLETNMMSFLRSGARLNTNKQLKADDGTTLAVNGT
jgi:hypothetical protein